MSVECSNAEISRQEDLSLGQLAAAITDVTQPAQ